MCECVISSTFHSFFNKAQQNRWPKFDIFMNLKGLWLYLSFFASQPLCFTCRLVTPSGMFLRLALDIVHKDLGIKGNRQLG